MPNAVTSVMLLVVIIGNSLKRAGLSPLFRCVCPDPTKPFSSLRDIIRYKATHTDTTWQPLIMKPYYLLRIAAYLVRFVPHRVAYWRCSIIGGIVFTLNWRVRESVLDNMGHVLPKASRRLRRVLGRR